MAIKQYTNASSEADIDSAVQTVIGGLGMDARSFQHASEQFNSDFFKDEDAEFTRRLCRALNFHFQSVGTNTFWQKNAE